jgi:hypothetical protein
VAALVFAESGVLLGALTAFVVISVFNGIMLARRMGKVWPSARDLNPAERVAVSSAARRGHRMEEARLAPAAIEYVAALRDAHAQGRRWRWLMWVGGAAMLLLAVSDTLVATPRTAAVSWLFVGFFAVELFWWPSLQDRLLANAERTGESARRTLPQQHVDDA